MRYNLLNLIFNFKKGILICLNYKSNFIIILENKLTNERFWLNFWRQNGAVSTIFFGSKPKGWSFWEYDFVDSSSYDETNCFFFRFKWDKTDSELVLIARHKLDYLRIEESGLKWINKWIEISSQQTFGSKLNGLVKCLFLKLNFN